MALTTRQRLCRYAVAALAWLVVLIIVDWPYLMVAVLLWVAWEWWPL